MNIWPRPFTQLSSNQLIWFNILSDDATPPTAEDTKLKADLAALDAQLQNQHKEAAEKAAKSQVLPGSSGIDGQAIRASRIGTELLVAIGAGLGLGWLLDKAFGTLPLFMLVFAFVGFGAGILNVWRLLNGRYSKVGFKE